MAEQQHPRAAGSEAIDWLVGRLRWEHILRDLHDRAEGDGNVDPVAALTASVRSRTARIGIVGLGYVGLPLVREFTRSGFRVTGFDVDKRKVKQLRAGESYIKHIPSDAIRAMRQRLFEATADFRRLDEPDAIIICVPTPLTESRDPDLTYVVNSSRSVAG